MDHILELFAKKFGVYFVCAFFVARKRHCVCLACTYFYVLKLPAQANLCVCFNNERTERADARENTKDAVFFK